MEKEKSDAALGKIFDVPSFLMFFSAGTSGSCAGPAWVKHFSKFFGHEAPVNVRVFLHEFIYTIPTAVLMRGNQPTTVLLHNSQLYCAVPLLLLKPGNTFSSGSTRVWRGACPPYSSRYNHHRGKFCTIHSSSVEAIRIHAQRRLCPCASHRCPQLLVVCTHFGSLLKKSNTKYNYRLGVI